MWARGQLKAPPRFTNSDTDDPDALQHLDQTDQALAAFGLQAIADPTQPEQCATHSSDTPLYLWPENWPVWCLWRDLETQWHAAGMGGATGLDYPGVWSLIDRRFRRSVRRTVFSLVQAMEDATLAEWRERDARQSTG